MKKCHLVMPLVCLLLSSCIPVGIQTFPDTDEDQVRNLMDIHYKIANTIEVYWEDAKFIFAGDFHRGYGEFDKFHFSEDLYCAVIDEFQKMGYTLVLMGDIEEGWGFQKNNIPLIQKFHEKSIKAEQEFIKANRYYRLFGNHDDFYRGGLMAAGGDAIEVHSAIKIHLLASRDHNREVINKIFVTHGAQGHGLHDAGDELAAWGVFMKYHYLQNAFFKKEKLLRKKAEESGYSLDADLNLRVADQKKVDSAGKQKVLEKLEKEATGLKNVMNRWVLFHGYDNEGSLLFPTNSGRKNTLSEKELLDIKSMSRVDRKFKGHEKIVIDWAKTKDEGAIDTLILGHTHVSVFNSEIIRFIEDQKENYIPESKKSLFSKYFQQNKSFTISDRGDKFQYHNTGATSADAVPCLVLTKGRFEYYFFKKLKNGKIIFNVITTNPSEALGSPKNNVSEEYDLSGLANKIQAGDK